MTTERTDHAAIAMVCEMGAGRGVDPNGPTVWEEE